MTLRAVFFDLDGTLLDTSLDLGSALNNVRSTAGLTPLAPEVIRPHVSNGAAGLIKLGFGEALSDTDFADYRHQLLTHYADAIAQHTRPFAGVESLIEQLHTHGIAWGIVTNKPRAYTESLMQHFTFAAPPSATVCPDHVNASKPAAEPLLLACQLTGCLPTEAIYIGDHLRDIECGRNAGMPTIAVGYGFTDTADAHLKWNASHTVEHASEIWPVISTYL